MKRFASHSPKFVDNSRAYSHGSLGFKPGQYVPDLLCYQLSLSYCCFRSTYLSILTASCRWWINGMFAFRDGIIDEKCTDGGICWNENGAYAIVMKESDEIGDDAPLNFTYKCSEHDRGKYRLTSTDFRSRYPVRVLRSHTLCSLWAPRVGLRYDGL
jgi:hypothetical protein